MKIGKVYFNEKELKDVSYSNFKKTYEKFCQKNNVFVDFAWESVTGKKVAEQIKAPEKVVLKTPEKEEPKKVKK